MTETWQSFVNCLVGYATLIRSRNWRNFVNYLVISVKHHYKKSLDSRIGYYIGYYIGKKM